MDMEDLARSMMARMPWDVAQKVLKLNGAPRGRGWQNTRERLIKSEKKFAHTIDPLEDALKEHMLCGEKLTRLYKVGEKTRRRMKEAILNLTPSKSPFLSAYPGSATEEVLTGLKPDSPKLVAVESSEGGVAAVYASVRIVEERESLDPASFPEAVSEELSNFDELVGVRYVHRQAMDVVWIPNAGEYVDVRIDETQGMNHEMGKAAHERLRKELHSQLSTDFLRAPVNFFPLIAAFYESDRGRVVELAFGTTTQSLKHEKMRRSKNCLRKEAYHKGGKQALKTPIEPYRISIVWDVSQDADVSTHPEVSFFGSLRSSLSASPVLHEVLIRKCIGVADFDVVRLEIEEQLQEFLGTKTA